MNKPILIAFCHANEASAHALGAALSGFEPSYLHEANDVASGQFAFKLQQSESACILLVTENLLKNERCMSGTLATTLTLLRQNRIAIVIADGINEFGDAVETHIDRVVYALQYMNHWQTQYLRQSDLFNHAEPEQKAAIEMDMNNVHAIANQIGEFITTLRDADPLKYSRLQEQQFDPIYRLFQVKKPIEPVQAIAVPELPSTPPAPEAPITAEPAISAPSVAAVLFTPVAPVSPIAGTTIPAQTQASPETANSGSTGQEEGQYQESEIERTIQDARFWLDKGNTELGMGILEVAIQQYPDHAGLRVEYERVNNPAATEAVGSTTAQVEEEARSYEAAGDSAFEGKDYLMAKYCWDRAAEVHPNLVGIYRKLGILTQDYLSGYSETSIIYLKKALEQTPGDSEVLSRLGLDTPQETATEDTPIISEPASTVPEIVAEITTQAEDLGATAAFEPMAEAAVHTEETIPETTNEVPAPVEPAVETAIQPEATPAEAETVVPTAELPIPVAKGTVLITGATSGIGKATAFAYAAQGYRLILTGRRQERLEAIRAGLEQQYGTEVLTLVFDVRIQSEVEQVLTHLPEAWQQIDILVNNAGLAKGLSPIQEGELRHWEQMIDTNIKGLLYVTRCIAPMMIARRTGHIINVCSVAGKEVYPNGNVYCATKSAVDALTRSTRIDLHKYGIRVGQVSPGHVEETEFALTRFDGDAERARIYEDFQPLMAADVADAIYYMTSRPPHVNILDMDLFGTQQASATIIDRSGRS